MSPSSFLVAARSYGIPRSGLGSRTHLQSVQIPVKIRAIKKKVGETRPEIVDVVVSKEDMMRIERNIQLSFFISEAQGNRSILFNINKGPKKLPFSRPSSNTADVQ